MCAGSARSTQRRAVVEMRHGRDGAVKEGVLQDHIRLTCLLCDGSM